MGFIWKSAMPLLSTLAALVIIVHSAEEDRESEYMTDLRPRILDTGTPSYEEPWRVVDTDSLMKQTAQSNMWSNDSPEEPPKRRRPGRKRKRRPQTSFTEGLASQETNNYPEEPLRPYFEVDLTNTEQSGETPKRRRKKLEPRPGPWTDVPQQRPFRRRGHRRKHPSFKTLPELKEIGDYRNEVKISEHSLNISASSDQKDINNSDQNNYFTLFLGNKDNNEENKILHHNPVWKEPENPGSEESKDEFSLITKNIEKDKIEHRSPYLQEDKSLSEFSLESMHHTDEPKENETKVLRDEFKDKSAGVFDEYKKSQSTDPVDPITLKDILKKSNGTSLSEILQLHNLSLADLLHGKENAISILKSRSSPAYKEINNMDNNVTIIGFDTDSSRDLVENGTEEKLLLYSETKDITDPGAKYVTSTHMTTQQQYSEKEEIVTSTIKPENNTHKILGLRRHPLGARRKLRIRPMNNSTFKSQLSREFTMVNARKSLHDKRNTSKSMEFIKTIPSIINVSTTDSDQNEDLKITTANIEDHLMTKSDIDNTNRVRSETEKTTNFAIGKESELITITSVKPEKALEYSNTEKTTSVSTMKFVTNSPAMRRHTLYNRYKKKRLRQKNFTTESPQIQSNKIPLENGNILSSTEFITKAQEPSIQREGNEFVTLLEDFMTTPAPSNVEINSKLSYASTSSSISSNDKITTQRLPEKPAQIEIDEIFNDFHASARLARILRDRNMTLNELVEHRERGSSHIHLADIFHNTSKKPNPPEPFLSKSIIEPISKETYPLRAILEANAHDTTYKPLINEPSSVENSHNIPVVMDYGNNVNEHAENMGIMSLFNNFTKNTLMKKVTIQNDLEERMHNADLAAVNTTPQKKTVRESRVITDNNNDDVVSWNEIFSLMKRNYKNETKDLLESIHNDPSISEIPKKITVEDVDGNNVIILEDLQNLKVVENNIAPDSNERLEVGSLGQIDSSDVFEKIPSQTKSITVATASIAGLALVLFLLAYAVFKWKQQKVVPGAKQSFCNEKIPTPVFENRKGHKNNSSTRSISPMLSTSNIYTLNTLDSRNGRDSPEYMWDTLRKPFQ